VVITHFFPAHGGGIELVAARLVDEYLASGFTVEWFASATDAPPPVKPGLSTHPVRASNIVERVTQLPYPLWTPMAIPTLWRVIGRARAVHVHEHLYIGSLLALLIGRIRRKRVVLTQHMGSLRLPSRLATTLYTLGARTLAWPAMRLASHVAFVSANVRRFFDSADAPGARVSTVFNGLDNETFAFADEYRRRESRARLGLGTDEPVAIFAGRFVRKKGLLFLRDLAARTHEVKWLFAGWGPEDPGLWRLGNVVCLGRLSQPDLAQALAAADVLVLPSLGEGFPLVVQEALACGTAVLSTDEVRSACPAASDMIGSVASSGSDADLACWDTALRASLACKSDEATRLRRAKQAEALWSWHACALHYLDRLGLRRRAPDPVSTDWRLG
jgi:glycosyltransferase involved in cell wall biosynthesis